MVKKYINRLILESELRIVCILNACPFWEKGERVLFT